MEKKEYKILKNILMPVKSVIEIGPEGIVNKGKKTNWEDITSFTNSLQIINKAHSYNITYTNKQNKTNRINFIVPITGKKKKKELFKEIYNHFQTGFAEKIVYPQSKELADSVINGETIEVAKAKLSKDNIVVRPGLMKKKELTIAFDDIRILHVDGTGGFHVGSKNSEQKGQELFMYDKPDTRLLLAVLERLKPDQAQVYFN